MKKLLLFAGLCLLMLTFFACGTPAADKQPYPEIAAIVTEVQKKYIPDRRVDVFDISVIDIDGVPVLKGETTVAEAQVELLSLAQAVNTGVVDSILLLPDAGLNGETYGFINLSVANFYSQNKYSAEMSTQALLGMPVRVLQHKDGWWRVRATDGYIGWMLSAGVHKMTKEEFNAWTESPKVVFTDIYGFAYENADEKGATVSDLVSCNMLRLEGDTGRFYKVSFPDGRAAYVLKAQSKLLEDWLAAVELTEESILTQAHRFMGLPYLWGGTSAKGMDCSGLTKTVLFMHGVIIPRDASQQAYTGIQVDITNGYDKLRKGDIMIFGKKAEGDKKERIRHVGFYMGSGEFIHAAGRVKVNSLNPLASNYDEYNTKEFLRAVRVIGSVDSLGISSVSNHPMYKVQE